MKFAPSAFIILSTVTSLISAASVKAPAAPAVTLDLSQDDKMNMFNDVIKKIRLFADRIEANTALRDDLIEATSYVTDVHLKLKLPKISFTSITALPKLLMKMPGDAAKISSKMSEVFNNHKDEIVNLLKTDEEIKAEKEKQPHVQRRFA